MKHFKRRWKETRGDEFDSWGFSTWYFEIDEDSYPTRQIEVYDSGKILRYSPEHLEDDFGGLGDQPLLDVAEFENISKEEFKAAWHKAERINE